jgi:hypothetical protein
MLMVSLRSITNVSTDTWKRLEEKNDIREAREEIINTYEMMYTLEEIKALDAFYSSPVGKKELTTRPFMIQQALLLIQQRYDRIAGSAAAETEQQKK